MTKTRLFLVAVASTALFTLPAVAQTFNTQLPTAADRAADQKHEGMKAHHEMKKEAHKEAHKKKAATPHHAKKKAAHHAKKKAKAAAAEPAVETPAQPAENNLGQ